jgi:hypothetical protein
MIAEMKSYRGVSCISCGSRIAVSGTVANRKDNAGSEESTAKFIARCKVCDHENIYSVAEVATFAGAPPAIFRSNRLIAQLCKSEQMRIRLDCYKHSNAHP